LTAQIAEAKYEEKMRKYNVDARFMDSQRQQLDQELLGLQSHNENRAKLDVKRQDLQARRQEMDTA
jgi:G3E family GTPase